ncbi:SWIM zinc finger domain protein [Dictyocaulus viviparus]|uniref:SWIM zinc finger domain protein n=1 Tax=Dictyocaulus viviparus TaxID=29172 RepID=A0A0D8Y6C9_DICVI|nr:SWIM zinc finger domain protein [Dictyocaulus viviparus]
MTEYVPFNDSETAIDNAIKKFWVINLNGMSGEDDWLVQAAAHEAGMLHPAPDSFEDSDRFEGDSECSWVSSESITLGKNWRGWSQCSPSSNIQSGISSCIYPYQCGYSHSSRYSSSNNVTLRNGYAEKASRNIPSLSDLSAKVCARQMSFLELERNYRDICRNRQHISEVPISHSLPDKLFLSVVYFCFPSTIDDIRLYSCLANGNADEFNHGDNLYQIGAVRDVVQIGYLLSAVVCASSQECVQTQRSNRIVHNVSLNVDRCRVVSCDCSCPSKSAWCQHVVALCLYRIHQPNQVQFRVTIWDSVNELSVDKLKKFAQYLVTELPKEFLPVAQRLLDQLKRPESEINQSHGAPDPTDGGHEQNAIWALDVEGLHTSIRRLLIKYCVPAPTVHCDVQYLGTAQHPIAAEWLTIMKSLRAREPEGIWNLMAIVREMFARRDENAVSLLSIITVECLANCQLAVLLRTYHRTAVERIWKVIGGTGGQDAAVVSSSHQASLLMNSIQDVNNCSLSINNAHFGLRQFPGFHPCLQVCHALIDESVPGVSQVAVLHLPEACGNDTSIPLQPLAPSTSSQKKNEKGKRKKKKSRSRSTIPTAALDFPPLPIFNDEASLDRAVRYAKDGDHRDFAIRKDSLREEDSSESGQESDVQLTPSLGDVQIGGNACFVQEEVDAVLAAAYLPMEPIEVRFARCEALAAHGYMPQATTLALQLADYLIDRLREVSDVEESKANNGSVGSSPDIVLESAESFVIRSHRFVDMIEKALYIAYEGEIVSLLHAVSVSPRELDQLRDAAIQISSTVGCQVVPPIALAHFILDRLSYVQNMQQNNREILNRIDIRGPQDDEIALKAALDALGSRPLFSEEDYPQLSEAVRRQKGELAIALLTRHRDSTEKLGLILDRLLDPSMHKMYSWHQSNAAYFLDRDPTYMKYGQRGQRPTFPAPSHSPPVQRSISLQSADSNHSVFDEEIEFVSDQIQSLRTSSIRLSDEGNESARHTSATTLITGEPLGAEPQLSMKSSFKKLKRKFTPVVCTTEAHAHYMHELARRVLTEAGGNQSSVVFAPIGQNPLASNRKLHMCAFLIGMYAIGLHNQVCASWKSRTYSTHVSWINLQASELGLMAVEVVRETWPTHLTPSEAAGLADKAGQSRDPAVVEEAARLALSVLPYAYTLSAAETQRALSQCGEQGAALLESACRAIEEAANKEIVFADVLFRVARYWYSLHYELDHKTTIHHHNRQNQTIAQSLTFNSNNHQQQYFNMSAAHPQQYYYEHIHPSHSVAFMQGHPPPGQAGQAGSGNSAPIVNEMGRLHQSQSAPQLSGSRIGTQVGSETRPRLVNAHRVGIQALASMAASANDDNRQYSKYSQTPPYTEDIRWLFSISVQLGTPYFVSFLDAVAKAVSSPFLLFQFAMEANTRLPPYPQQYSMLPINRSVPPPQSSHSSKAFAHVAGRTRAVMLQTYAHPSTAELYERCIEQFYAAAAVKLSHNRFNNSDMEDAHQLLVAAIAAFMRIPHPPTAHSLLEDFYRHVKKQKAWKKDVQHRLGSLLHEALNQQR